MHPKQAKFVLLAWKTVKGKTQTTTLYFNESEASDMNQDINYYRANGYETKVFEERSNG